MINKSPRDTKVWIAKKLMNKSPRDTKLGIANSDEQVSEGHQVMDCKKWWTSLLGIPRYWLQKLMNKSPKDTNVGIAKSDEQAS